MGICGSSGRSYGRCCLVVAVGWMVCGGCRVKNPGFGFEEQGSSGSNLRSDRPSEDTKTEHANASSHSGAASADETVSAVSTNLSTGSTSGTSTDPVEMAARSYCSQGSHACYAMVSVQDGRFFDRGAQAGHMVAKGLSTVTVNQDNYPLGRAVQTGAQSEFRTEVTYPTPEKGVIGFGVWLRPKDPTAKAWTAFDRL